MELFGGCNYTCKMCPQGTDVGREKEFKKCLKWDVFTKIVDDGIKNGVKTITLHGGGEPTLHKKFIECIKYIRNQDIQCIAFTNGYALDKKLCQDIAKSGLSILRISVIGYNRETYKKWMNIDAFELVRDNVKYLIQQCKGTPTKIFLSHLITDEKNKEYELEQYKNNWVEYTGIKAEIWMMHNWSGIYSGPYLRSGKNRRTCGRPLSPRLEVRAGGIGKKQGAVVVCCMMLGHDSKATLGHLDDQTINDVINGKLYRGLVSAHREERFDDISYCKDCDQLYHVPDSLVWTNIENRKYYQSLGEI